MYSIAAKKIGLQTNNKARLKADLYYNRALQSWAQPFVS